VNTPTTGMNRVQGLVSLRDNMTKIKEATVTTPRFSCNGLTLVKEFAMTSPSTLLQQSYTAELQHTNNSFNSTIAVTSMTRDRSIMQGILQL